MTTQAKTATQKLPLVGGVNDGLRTALKQDDSVFLMGEDIGVNGGVFRATDGLVQEFGEERVIDTPLSEAGIVGVSVGMALAGFKPVIEMQFLGFIYPAFEQIMTHVTRYRMRTMGAYGVPMVIRAPYGAGIRAPEIHSDSTEALFTHMPGLKVVCPSNAYDAKGLLLASIADPDPVLFLESMRTYRAQKVDVPEEAYTVPIGKAAVLKEGTDISIFAWGAMVSVSLDAARKLAGSGISCEVIDLRTLSPLDEETIIASVQKTGRVCVVQEGHQTGGVAHDVFAVINDGAFLSLRAPLAKVAGYDVPVPLFALEDHYIPTVQRVMDQIQQTVTF